MDEFNAALVILRVGFGLTMAAHGYAKVFTGGKLAGTGRWFDSIGMKPGAVHARLAAGTEILAGLGLAVGLLTTFSAMGFVGVMAVAGYVAHRKNGFFIVKEGWEYTFILALGAVGIAMLGPGEWSLDHADRHRDRSRRLVGLGPGRRWWADRRRAPVGDVLPPTCPLADSHHRTSPSVLRKRSFSSGDPTVTRRPSPTNGRRTTPRFSIAR